VKGRVAAHTCAPVLDQRAQQVEQHRQGRARRCPPTWKPLAQPCGRRAFSATSAAAQPPAALTSVMAVGECPACAGLVLRLRGLTVARSLRQNRPWGWERRQRRSVWRKRPPEGAGTAAPPAASQPSGAAVPRAAQYAPSGGAAAAAQHAAAGLEEEPDAALGALLHAIRGGAGGRPGSRRGWGQLPTISAVPLIDTSSQRTFGHSDTCLQ
jgi:hypothetical protein